MYLHNLPKGFNNSEFQYCIRFVENSREQISFRVTKGVFLPRIYTTSSMNKLEFEGTHKDKRTGTEKAQATPAPPLRSTVHFFLQYMLLLHVDNRM
jgi:hypothetical protein